MSSMGVKGRKNKNKNRLLVLVIRILFCISKEANTNEGGLIPIGPVFCLMADLKILTFC